MIQNKHKEEKGAGILATVKDSRKSSSIRQMRKKRKYEHKDCLGKDPKRNKKTRLVLYNVCE